MSRPRLFLSAASEELLSARKAVAATVRTLGFDPVSQDDFPTGYGELRKWLREQIDSCEGLIQLVGHGYGAEPTEVDPDFGRVSYTQLEFLYASRQGKKTWVIFAGEGCSRDKPIDQLDLPREAAHTDTAGYQAERRKLQQDYLARLKQENHLRHTANNDTELQNIVLRLRDELGELRKRYERRLTAVVLGIFICLAAIIAGLYWAYKTWYPEDVAFKARTTGQLAEIAEATRLTTEKIRAHLLQTAEETHRRELSEADAVKDWKERQRLREAADNAHAARLFRIEELAASFAEIEGRGTATIVFKEMTRIVTEQGVDEAIAYVGAQRSSIFKAVDDITKTAHERIRATLQPLLKLAGLHEPKGQAAEARSLYTEILAKEPDWPEALHAAFWFHVNQGDIARVRTTIADASRDYEEAHRMAQRLITGDPTNTEWQLALSISYKILGDMAQAQRRFDEASRYYGESLEISQKLAAADPNNTQLQGKLMAAYGQLADVARAQGRLDEAARVYDDALSFFKKLAAGDPTNTKWQYNILICYERLGLVERSRKRFDEASRYYGESLEISQKLTAADPNNPDWQGYLVSTYIGLGMVAQAQRRFDEASRYYGESLEISQKLAAADPNNTQLQGKLMAAYGQLSEVAQAQDKLDEVARFNGESLEIAKKLAAVDPDNTAWQFALSVSYWRLADLSERQNKAGEAKGYWKQAFDGLSGIEKRGLHLSPEDRQFLETLRRKVGAAP